VEKYLKIVLAILLLLCLLDMPYGYFQLVRFIAMVGFSFLAFNEYQKKNKQLAFIYGALAVLFQPIFKISLGRDIWNIVDVVVAIGLIATLLKRSDK
jgi:hypothetical protein